MQSSGSVTGWIESLREGEQEAAQRLWERYFDRLVNLARDRLNGAPRRVADEEDVALSAFDSFCRCTAQGRFPRLADRCDLWRLLVVLTARKASRLRTHEQRQKRGGGNVSCEADHNEANIAELIGPEPTPDFAAQVAEEYRALLRALQDATLESIAVWKMEGFSNGEIAAKLACAPRTVERKLQRIRSIWHAELGK